MSSIHKQLRLAVPTAIFGPPAQEGQIAEAERLLNVRFPAWLRDLYLHCDGIRSGDGGAAYLFSLEKNEHFPESLVSWNQFHRDQWLQLLPDYRRYQPEINWDELDVRKLLIVAGQDAYDWAINPAAGPEILTYDVRNPEDREVIAADLVEACVSFEAWSHEIHEDIFRGRESYRGEFDKRPPTCDIETIYDMIIRLHRDPGDSERVRTGWHLHRATSKRPGESGDLFIIPIGGDDEIQLASRDGNVPFIMRLKGLAHDHICIVQRKTHVLMYILRARDALSLPWTDGTPPTPDDSEIRRIWRDVGIADPALFAMAAVLFARDDRRRVEENRLG